MKEWIKMEEEYIKIEERKKERSFYDKFHERREMLVIERTVKAKI